MLILRLRKFTDPAEETFRTRGAELTRRPSVGEAFLDTV
jgi:hypothetical protein